MADFFEQLSDIARMRHELNKYKEFINKARLESKLCVIDGQHFILVPYWFMMDIGDSHDKG